MRRREFCSVSGTAACDHGHWLRVVLLVATALGVPALPALAQDATWNLNGTGDFNIAANWTPATVPTGTAFFGVSNQNAVFVSAAVAIGGFTFNAGASNYTFDAFTTFEFTGAGVVINGGSATIDASGFFTFRNASTAGSATFNNNGGSARFLETSTAGSAIITNTNLIQFLDASSAGAATVTNLITGTIRFSDSTSAGSAAITNIGELTFRVTGTAGSATITNNFGLTQFFDSASAGGATITNNNGLVRFFDSTGAGSATIINNNSLEFRGNSTAASATITNANTAILQFFDTATAGSAFITNNNGVQFNDNSTAGSATITNNTSLQFTDATTAGGANITNNGGLQFFNSTTAGSATITNFNVVQFLDTSTASSAFIVNNNGNPFDGVRFFNTSTAGSATIVNNGVFVFANTSTAGNATITNNDRLIVNNNATAGNARITNNNSIRFLDTASGGTARLINGATGIIDLSELTSAGTTAGSIEGGGGIALGSKSLTVGGNNLSTTFSGVIADGGNGGGVGGSLSKTGTGTLTLTGNNTYTGGATITGGFINFNSGNNFGTGPITLNGGGLQWATGNTTDISGRLNPIGAGGATFDTNGNNVTLAAALSGGGGVIKTGGGALTLSGANIYTGATSVGGGTLFVNGSIASSILTTVNPGATLGGTGTVGSTNINGGVLAPGNSIGTITIQGNLVLAAASTYQVEVSPVAADRTNVTGTASIGGTVQLVFQPGAYVVRSYIILSAAGGLGGTTFGGTAGALPNFTTSLNYTATDVLLNLTAALGNGSSLNRNQQSVANVVSNSFNSGDTMPPSFVTLFGLSGAALGNALTQLSGEQATGMAPASFLTMGLFLNTMLDPFVTGRSGGFGAGTAGEDAFAAAIPVTAAPAPAFAQRWSVWGTAYGGRNRTDGEPIGVGSNNLTATAAGFAAGADYRVSPGLTLGVAAAIGETRWSTGSLGSGDSNLAQIGGYAAARWSAFYLSGAIAGAWHNVDTKRTVTVAGFDRLEAGFDATAFGGRVEGGWRQQFETFGLTPYAAAQVQSVYAPAYSERPAAGAATFALSYNSQTTTDTRTELGLWADTQHGLANGALMVLRGRAAWVHDFNPESRINAVFQTLPGSSFTVNGAAAASDSALASAVGELRLRNGIALIARADGEFSSRATTYAGTGTVRYTW